MRTDFLRGYRDFLQKLGADWSYDADSLRKMIAGGSFDKTMTQHTKFYNAKPQGLAARAMSPASTKETAVARIPAGGSVRPPPPSLSAAGKTVKQFMRKV